MRIAGLDLSLEGLGVVVVPASWDYEFRCVTSASFGVELEKKASQREITDRLLLLSDDLTVWLDRQKATHVFVESLPTQAFNIAPLAELRCAVRLSLRRKLAIDIEIANQTSARHLFLGGLPKTTPSGEKFNKKAAIDEALKAKGARFRDLDQSDAFVVANFGLAALGAPHLKHLLFDPNEPKAKKPRARKAAAA